MMCRGVQLLSRRVVHGVVAVAWATDNVPGRFLLLSKLTSPPAYVAVPTGTVAFSVLHEPPDGVRSKSAPVVAHRVLDRRHRNAHLDHARRGAGRHRQGQRHARIDQARPGQCFAAGVDYGIG